MQELELFVKAMLEFGDVSTASHDAANVAALQGRITTLEQEVASARADAEAAAAQLKVGTVQLPCPCINHVVN